MKNCSIALIAITVAACGGSTTVITPPGQSATCSVTLSGGLTGTYDCGHASLAWDSSNNKFGFGISLPQAGTTPGITVAFGAPGEPQATTYTNTTTGGAGGATVVTGSGAGTQAWAASEGSTSVGTFSLKLDSVSNAVTASSGKAYSFSGTWDATLKYQTGTGPDVTLHATF